MAKGPTRRAARPVADDGRKIVAQNRRARDAYARVEGAEIWLLAMHIPPWLFATGFGAHDPERRRRLLLHKRQINELGNRVAQESLTLVPLALYFRNGRAKV